MKLLSSLLLSTLPFALVGKASGVVHLDDVSLRSSVKKTARDASGQVPGVSVVKPGERYIAPLPCLGCPPISSAAEDEPSILLFHLDLTADRRTLRADNQIIYPLPEPQKPLPTLHARQWPADLVKEDINTALADYEGNKHAEPYRSDYRTLAYQRNVFPIAGVSADIIQLDILGVGTPVKRPDEDPAATKTSEDGESAHAGTPLDSPHQKMLQILIRRDPSTGALSIARVDLVDRLPSGAPTDPEVPVTQSWRHRVANAFGPPPAPNSHVRPSSKVSTGGLHSYFQPPVYSTLPSKVWPTTLGEWFGEYWLDLAVLLTTVFSCVFILYLVYLAGSYIRRVWGHNSRRELDETPEHRWLRMQRAKRYRGSLERVLEEGQAVGRFWDEKRRASVPGPIGRPESPYADEVSRDRSFRKPSAPSIKTGPTNSRGRRATLPPTPVENWSEGSGWGWGWGER